MTSTPNNTTAYCFGGVFDVEDDEEDIAGQFYNDFYSLDLEKLSWKNLVLSSKKNKEEKKPIEEEEITEIEMKTESTTIADDGIFKVTVGPSSTSNMGGGALKNTVEAQVFQPSPRINCGLAIKHGVLYLYGGMFEDGDKQITFSDFYSIDLRKMEEWKIITPDDVSKQEWLGSENESSEEGEEEDEDDDEEEDGTSENSDV